MRELGKIMNNEFNIEASAAQISEKKQDIKYDTRDYVIGYLVNCFNNGDFYIPDDYQRNFIWDKRQKCSFIESILMGLPIPFMFFADTEDGRIEIVDGAQRTQTVTQFIEDDLTLEGLKILDKSNGFKFSDLEESIRRRFLNTSVRVVYLEEGTTEITRQEIFNRINTGGKHLNPAEIRRGSLAGVFYSFLEECTKDELFNKLAPRTKLTEARFEGVELVTRFFAYYDNYENGYADYSGNVTEYIDKYVEHMNEICKTNPEIIDEHRNVFKLMLKCSDTLLGDRGFKKSKTSKSTPRARFEALAVGIALATKEKSDLRDRDVTDWLDSEEFQTLVKSDAANNKSKLLSRINFVRSNLLGA